MKNHPHTLSRTLGALLAAAALPFTPLVAQTVEPEPTAPVTIDAAPPAPSTSEPTTTVTSPTPSMEPVVNSAPSGNEPDASETTTATTATSTPVRRAPVRSRTTTRAPASDATPTSAPPAEVATGPDPFAELTAPAPAATAAAPPPPVLETPEIIDERNWFDRAVPWLILALIVAGGALFVLGRRRRRREAVYYDERVAETHEAPSAAATTPAIVEDATPTASPMAQPAAAAAPGLSTLVRNPKHVPGESLEPAAEVAPAPQAGTVSPVAAGAAGAAAAAGTAGAAAAGAPGADLRLAVRPLRAGITGDNAVAEFELMIENRGPGAVRNLRISTWMFPAGSDAQSEAEQMLIVRPPAAVLDEVGAGERQRIEASVTLPRSRIAGDSLLPVVATEARYTTDAGDRRTSARFAVGVPLDGELAHFDVENPSGMHNNVEARLLDTNKA